MRSEEEKEGKKFPTSKQKCLCEQREPNDRTIKNVVKM